MDGYDILKKIGYDNESITSTEKWIAEEVYKLKRSPETGRVDGVAMLPCPFCGQPPEKCSNQHGHFGARCYNCGIIMMHDRSDKLVALWNRRAT